MSAATWVALTVAGGIGAVVRYLVGGMVQARTRDDLPWGTFTVNGIGTLVLAGMTGLAVHGHLGAASRAVVGAGFCGGLTTFSTFTYEIAMLLRQEHRRAAFVVAGGGLGVGLVAAATGLALAALLAG